MKSRRNNIEVSAGSMADIAFLLLIFFLVTTTMDNDKGLLMRLPPKQDEPPVVPIPERNLFNILINSQDELMVEGELPYKFEQLRKDIKTFVLNDGRDEKSSDNPKEAIVSIKVNRGTSYRIYVQTLDEVQAAYFEIYGERVGLTPDEFRKLDLREPKQKMKYDIARAGIPMNISIAKPSN